MVAFVQSSDCILLLNLRDLKFLKLFLNGSRQTFLGISAFEPFSFSLFFQPSLEQAILEVLSKLTWSILFNGCPM